VNLQRRSLLPLFTSALKVLRVHSEMSLSRNFLVVNSSGSEVSNMARRMMMVTSEMWPY
jgi:hypothetical protein